MIKRAALKVVLKGMQSYWRWSRGLTLGVQCCLIDEDGQIVLVRHSYRPGWHFPGGGVEKGEPVRAALRRELEEEVSVKLNEPPDLFSTYANFKRFPNDHIVLFVARGWTQTRNAEPNLEIAEIKRFPLDSLPDSLHPPVGRRLREIFEDELAADDW